MTLFTSLIYSAFFVACVTQCCANKDKTTGGVKYRRSSFAYVPDLAYYFITYNRLMNQGNLHDQRPFILRRDAGEEKSKEKRGIDGILSPITGLMGPLGSMFGGGSNATRRNPDTMKRCTRFCQKTDKALCVQYHKVVVEFESACEFKRLQRCSDNFQEKDGWKIRKRGNCPKIIDKHVCRVTRERLAHVVNCPIPQEMDFP